MDWNAAAKSAGTVIGFVLAVLLILHHTIAFAVIALVAFLAFMGYSLYQEFKYSNERRR